MSVQWDNTMLDTCAEYNGIRLHVVSPRNRQWLAFVDETIVAESDGRRWFTTKSAAQNAAVQVAKRKHKLATLKSVGVNDNSGAEIIL